MVLKGHHIAPSMCYSEEDFFNYMHCFSKLVFFIRTHIGENKIKCFIVKDFKNASARKRIIKNLKYIRRNKTETRVLSRILQ